MWEIQITIGKRDRRKGLLLLEEIKELYGHSPSIEQMIGTLWINFIEEYKSGRIAFEEIISSLAKRDL